MVVPECCKSLIIDNLTTPSAIIFRNQLLVSLHYVLGSQLIIRHCEHLLKRKENAWSPECISISLCVLSSAAFKAFRRHFVDVFTDVLDLWSEDTDRGWCECRLPLVKTCLKDDKLSLLPTPSAGLQATVPYSGWHWITNAMSTSFVHVKICFSYIVINVTTWA